jgi:hypothetical protein
MPEDQAVENPSAEEYQCPPLAFCPLWVNYAGGTSVIGKKCGDNTVRVPESLLESVAQKTIDKYIQRGNLKKVDNFYEITGKKINPITLGLEKLIQPDEMLIEIEKC